MSCDVGLLPTSFNNNEHSLDNNNGDSHCSSKRKVIVFVAFASLDQSQNCMSSCDVIINLMLLSLRFE